jgi:hypothetical protein
MKIFQWELTFVRCAKVGELCATHSESEKFTVLAEIGLYKTAVHGSFDIFYLANNITVSIVPCVTHLYCIK